MRLAFLTILLSAWLMEIASGIQCITDTSGANVTAVLTTEDGWIRDGITAHNTLRARHAAPALTYNGDLCPTSQWIANRNNELGELRHTSQLGGYELNCGENLAYYGSSAPLNLGPAQETVQRWYDEVADYDFSTGEAKTAGAAVGHFTQIVWKGTQEMCMAYTKRADGTRFYVAAHYYPRGNIAGQFIENVVGGCRSKVVPLNLLLIGIGVCGCGKY